MAEIKRSDIIEDDALKAPLVLAENMDVAYEALMKFIKAGREAGVMQAATTSTKQLREESEKLTQTEEQLLKVEKQIAALIAKDNDEYRAQQKIIQDLNAQLKTKTALGDREAASINKTNASIKELGAALNANRAAYANLRSEQARNSKEGQDLLKTIQQQDKEFKELKNSIGQNQENVGNYEGAVRGLKEELKQARDAMAAVAMTLGEQSPEFKANAARAGELKDKLDDLTEAQNALSGEPIEKWAKTFGVLGEKLKAADFKGAKAQVQNLIAISKEMTFKQATEGLGSFASSLGGLGKAILTNPLFLLAAVITGVTVALIKFAKYIDPLVKVFNLIGDGVDFVAQKFKDFTDSLGLTSFAVADAYDRMIAANDKLAASTEKTFEREIALMKARGEATEKEEIKLYQFKRDMATDNWVASGKELARLRALGKKDDDERVKALLDRIDKESAIYEDARNQIAIIEAQLAQKSIALNERQTKARVEAIRLGAEAEAKALDATAAQAGKGFEQRIAASEKAERKRLAIIEAAKQEELRIYNETNKEDENLESEKAVIVKQYEQQKQDIRQQYAKQQRDLLIQLYQDNAKAADEIVKNEHRSFEARVEAVYAFGEDSRKALDLQLQAQLITQTEYDASVLKLTEDTTDKLVQLTLDRAKAIQEASQQKADTATASGITDLNDQLGAQLITYKEYQDQVTELQENAHKQRMQNELDALKEQAEILKSYGQDTTAIEKQIADTELAISDERIAKRIEGEELLQQRLAELQQSGQQAIVDIVTNFNEAADEERAARMEKVKENLAIDLELAGDNEAKKVELKNKAMVEEQKIRQQQAAADRKRALFEKATAAVSVIINTAKGVGQALGTYPPPVSFVLAAVTAALGAVQLATIISKPIPQYALGTENHPGGLAILGDGGKREVVFEPGEQPYLSGNRPEVHNLKKGTVVIPSVEQALSTMALNNLQLNDRRGVHRDAQLDSIDKGISQLSKDIRANRPNDAATAAMLREMARHELAKQHSLQTTFR